MPRFLIILGLSILILGIIFPLIEKLGFGKLPGDIYIEKENFKFYFPITTSIIFSCFASFIIWFTGKYF